MPYLNSLLTLSRVLASNPLTSTVGNVNVLDVMGESTPVCYLPHITSFTNYDGTHTVGSYESLAAVSLALEHLNTGNGTIVKELSGINERCPLRFTSKAFDMKGQQRVAVDEVITMTDRSRTDQLTPCAILGASFSYTSIPTSIISGLRGFPQISPSATSSVLDDASQFKLFGRTITNDDSTAIPLLAKLASWNVNYLSVLHVDDPYGNSFSNGIRFAAQEDYPSLRVNTMDIIYGASDDAISQVVRLLKESQAHFFFAIVYFEDVDRIMAEAYAQGIAGTGIHTWIFSDGVGLDVAARNFPVGSQLEKAYRGSAVLTAVGGIPGIELYDKLTISMQQLGESEADRSYLEDLLPIEISRDEFANYSIGEPGIFAPFLFDAAVALGLASCRLVQSADNGYNFTGGELFRAFLDTAFEGASGTVTIDPETGTRKAGSALYTLINFIDDRDAFVEDGMMRFKGVETDLFKSGGFEILVPYTFNDGTNDVPPDIPSLETKTNHLSTGIKVVGLLLCGVVVVTALSLSFWTHHNSEKGVVRASQPIFLHIISVGTLFMGLSIIPLSIDLGVTSQEGADAACMSFPWLLVIGFSLTFSALFTKTHRINKIMRSAAKFKRMKITAVDVMKPMITLLLLNIVILSLWTALDPIQRQTEVVLMDSFLRNIETYGRCYSKHAPFFLAILCVINLGSLLFAMFEAYHARHISTSMQESSYIFIAMALIFFVGFLGIPVLFIARENAAASYFVTAGLVFVVCASVLLLIFAPKIERLREMNREANVSTASSAKRWSVGPTTSVSDQEGIQVTNLLKTQADLEEDNRRLRQEVNRLISNERSQEEKLEE